MKLKLKGEPYSPPGAFQSARSLVDHYGSAEKAILTLEEEESDSWFIMAVHAALVRLKKKGL